MESTRVFIALQTVESKRVDLSDLLVWRFKTLNFNVCEAFDVHSPGFAPRFEKCIATAGTDRVLQLAVIFVPNEQVLRLVADDIGGLIPANNCVLLVGSPLQTPAGMGGSPLPCYTTLSVSPSSRDANFALALLDSIDAVSDKAPEPEELRGTHMIQQLQHPTDSLDARTGMPTLQCALLNGAALEHPWLPRDTPRLQRVVFETILSVPHGAFEEGSVDGRSVGALLRRMCASECEVHVLKERLQSMAFTGPQESAPLLQRKLEHLAASANMICPSLKRASHDGRYYATLPTLDDAKGFSKVSNGLRALEKEGGFTFVGLIFRFSVACGISDFLKFHTLSQLREPDAISRLIVEEVSKWKEQMRPTTALPNPILQRGHNADSSVLNSSAIPPPREEQVARRSSQEVSQMEVINQESHPTLPDHQRRRHSMQDQIPAPQPEPGLQTMINQSLPEVGATNLSTTHQAPINNQLSGAESRSQQDITVRTTPTVKQPTSHPLPGGSPHSQGLTSVVHAAQNETHSQTYTVEAATPPPALPLQQEGQYASNIHHSQHSYSQGHPISQVSPPADLLPEYLGADQVDADGQVGPQALQAATFHSTARPLAHPGYSQGQQQQQHSLPHPALSALPQERVVVAAPHTMTQIAPLPVSIQQHSAPVTAPQSSQTHSAEERPFENTVVYHPAAPLTTPLPPILTPTYDNHLQAPTAAPPTKNTKKDSVSQVALPIHNDGLAAKVADLEKKLDSLQDRSTIAIVELDTQIKEVREKAADYQLVESAIESVKAGAVDRRTVEDEVQTLEQRTVKALESLSVDIKTTRGDIVGVAQKLELVCQQQERLNANIVSLDNRLAKVEGWEPHLITVQHPTMIDVKDRQEADKIAVNELHGELHRLHTDLSNHVTATSMAVQDIVGQVETQLQQQSHQVSQHLQTLQGKHSDGLTELHQIIAKERTVTSSQAANNGVAVQAAEVEAHCGRLEQTVNRQWMEVGATLQVLGQQHEHMAFVQATMQQTQQEQQASLSNLLSDLPQKRGAGSNLMSHPPSTSADPTTSSDLSQLLQSVGQIEESLAEHDPANQARLIEKNANDTKDLRKRLNNLELGQAQLEGLVAEEETRAARMTAVSRKVEALETQVELLSMAPSSPNKI